MSLRTTGSTLLATVLTLSACGGAGGDPAQAPPPSQPTHAVGGTVTGLAGTGLVLQLNGGGDLTLGASASAFKFPVQLAEGTAYGVTVLGQPTNPPQRCDVSGGAGTVGGADVASVAVTCTPLGSAITLGGSVSGVVGRGLVLRKDATTTLAVAPGVLSFTFPGTVAPGSTYAVTVDSQPYLPWQTCTVANGTGTATSPVNSVAVVCSTNQYAVSGTVTGLTGTGLVLQLNNGAPLVVPAGATRFAFPPLPSMTDYSLAVVVQPTGPTQICSVLTAGGPSVPPMGPQSTVTFGDNTNALVDCGGIGTTVGGTVTGLSADGLALRLNGGAPLAVPAGAATFSFPTGVATGDKYGVTLVGQPAGQSCVLQHAKGVKGQATVSSVGVLCFANVTDPLSGTYSRASSGYRTYVTFWPDGTYSHASRDENPDCPKQGNGVEYGVYNYKASTGAFRFVTTPTNGDGFCGFDHGGGASLGGTLAKSGGTLSITSSFTGRTFTYSAVDSTPGSLVGSFSFAYGPSEGRDGSFAVFQADGTYILAQGQQGGGVDVGYERACYTSTSTALTADTTATCHPDGRPVVMTTSGGLTSGASIPYVVTGPDTVLVDGNFLLVRIVPN
jgi:hypothetical protein